MDDATLPLANINIRIGRNCTATNKRTKQGSVLDKLLEILGNSHFEAYVAGPVLGAILGALVTVLAKPSASNAKPDVPPAEVREQLRSRRSSVTVTHHHHYQAKSSQSNDDAVALLAVVGLASLVAIFLFAAYLPTVANIFAYAILTIAAFALTLCLTALIGQRYRTWEWWINAVAPLLILVGCYYALTIARASISDDVVMFANNLRNQHPHTVQGLLAGAFGFAKQIGNDYVRWMMLEMAAFVNILFITTLCALRCFHYLALANFRDGSGSWRWLAFSTERFGRGPSLVVAIAFLIVSVLLANGQIYQWLH